MTGAKCFVFTLPCTPFLASERAQVLTQNMSKLTFSIVGQGQGQKLLLKDLQCYYRYTQFKVTLPHSVPQIWTITGIIFHLNFFFFGILQDQGVDDNYQSLSLSLSLTATGSSQTKYRRLKSKISNMLCVSLMIQMCFNGDLHTSLK